MQGFNLQFCHFSYWHSRHQRYNVNKALRMCPGASPQARIMIEQTQTALSDAAEWLGDWHPLAEQLGSADGLVALSSVSSFLRLKPVHDLPSLRSFLRHYQTHIP